MGDFFEKQYLQRIAIFPFSSRKTLQLAVEFDLKNHPNQNMFTNVWYGVKVAFNLIVSQTPFEINIFRKSRHMG